MIRFGKDVCCNLDSALRREWLETNGIGGFASGTINGCNTRRYHGLLVAATKPPVGRIVLLSKLEETLAVNGRAYQLSTNRYPGVVHPQGFQFLTQFRLDPFPIFTFSVDGVELEKKFFMAHGQNTSIIQYQLINAPGADVQLELRPLIAFRDYHSLTHENGAINGRVDTQRELIRLSPYVGLPSLYLANDAVEIESTGHWYRSFEYDAERERGLDFQEDLFNPCVLRFDLNQRPTARLIASTEHQNVDVAERYERDEIVRRRQIAEYAPVKNDFITSLSTAADQYIVSRGEQKSVIAGYHWFADWGRDTMIALPGLTLPTGRFDIARSILRTFAQHVDQGMLPNRFPDAGETPEYNTVDATLWFFEAVRAYHAYTGDLSFVEELYTVLTDIINWHVRGTRYGIKLDAAGLLNSGDPGLQLTWMDAKVGDWVVTPRRGKPVEIQALWYNAICIMEELATCIDDDTSRKRYNSMAVLTKWTFNRLFWNERGGYLYDVVNGGSPDASIRPNQIFAVSLPHSMLSAERAKQVVAVVQEHLLTPYGLRSLAESDPQYHGRYTGDGASRDGVYHQGTVWPWLMGPFITAYMKVDGGSKAARMQAESWLSPLKNHLCDAGLGHISEIFDGDAPHRPVGCIAQAWSVAEVLRTAVEDVYGIRPGRLAALLDAVEQQPRETRRERAAGQEI